MAQPAAIQSSHEDLLPDGHHPSNVASFQTQPQTITIGTRKSALALRQVDLVLAALQPLYPNTQFVTKPRDTAAGDIDKVTPFSQMAVKNIWTHELEVLLLEHKLDFLVHALKDCPTQLPLNCVISATPEREDPRDVLVLKAGMERCTIRELPKGSVIGTSSVRRTAQLAREYPGLRVMDVRGNIDTRLRKLDDPEGPFTAIILGAAGLIRIGKGERITQFLSGEEGMMHAVGQGAIGLESRGDDVVIGQVMKKANHEGTFFRISAERALLRRIEGGCSAPLGVETRWVGQDGKDLELKAIVISIDGKEAAEVEVTGVVSSVEEAEKLGIKAGEQILDRGARKILDEIKAKKPTTAADLEEK